MYLKFMFTLTIGLVGMGIVLKTLLDTLFHEWDVVRDIQRVWHAIYYARPHAELVRAEDILMELDRDYNKRRMPERLIDRRREALRDLHEAEERLSVPQEFGSWLRN